MPDAVTTKYIFPPNWDVTEQQVQGTRRIVVSLTNLSDGSGESGVRKIDISKHLTSNNKTCIRTVIEKIEYNNAGFTAIRLYWERNPEETIAVFPGGLGGGNSGVIQGPLVDKDDGANNGEGNTGDIMITTSGATDKDSYDITLYIKLKDSAPTPLQGA